MAAKFWFERTFNQILQTFIPLKLVHYSIYLVLKKWSVDSLPELGLCMHPQQTFSNCHLFSHRPPRPPYFMVVRDYSVTLHDKQPRSHSFRVNHRNTYQSISRLEGEGSKEREFRLKPNIGLQIF